MTCRCQGTVHEGTCPYWEIARRYNDIYGRRELLLCEACVAVARRLGVPLVLEG
jgi:hypothetical protein